MLLVILALRERGWTLTIWWPARWDCDNVPNTQKLDNMLELLVENRMCPLLAIVLVCTSSALMAQTPPGDLTEMSLEQILGLRIVRSQDSPDVDAPRGKWSLSQRYIRVNFEGNRDGTTELSDEDVLWSGPPATRTDKNFPIVPHTIHQEAFVTRIGYEINDRWNWNLLIPYIVQETDHVANTALAPIPANFAEFIIRSEGLGDISLSPSYLVWEKGLHTVHLHSGVSLPVGRINVKDDTPAPGEDNQLPYTMQLGSGTLDYLPGITYAGQEGIVGWGGQVLATIRIGKNGRGYSLGDRVSISSWVKVRPLRWLEPSFNVTAQIWDRIDGVDKDFANPPGGFFPATVADPSKYGGEKVNVNFGVSLIGSGRFERHALDIAGGIPIYQRLNGPQPQERWRFNVSWNLDF